MRSIVSICIVLTLCLLNQPAAIADESMVLSCHEVGSLLPGYFPTEFISVACSIGEDNDPVSFDSNLTDLEQNLSEDEVMYLHAIDDAGFADEVRRHLLWLMLLWGGSL